MIASGPFTTRAFWQRKTFRSFTDFRACRYISETSDKCVLSFVLLISNIRLKHCRFLKIIIIRSILYSKRVIYLFINIFCWTFPLCKVINCFKEEQFGHFSTNLDYKSGERKLLYQNFIFAPGVKLNILSGKKETVV